MSILWQEAMLEVFRETTFRIAHALPKLLALLTFLALGLAVGWLVKFLFLRVLRAFRFDVLCERFGLGSPLTKAGMKQSASYLVGRLSFWLVFLLFAFMGIDALDLTATANMMSAIIAFLPQNQQDSGNHATVLAAMTKRLFQHRVMGGSSST